MPPKAPAAPGTGAAAQSKPAAKAPVKPRAKMATTKVPANVAGDAVPTMTSPTKRIGGGWLAVGVGSAALVAALLFATRGKRNDWIK